MTEKLKNLLSDIVFENEFSSKSLQTILKSCHEYQNFADKDSSFISQINSNLNANINIEQNHLLLNTVILQCSEELLLNHAISWMSFCIRSGDSLSASIQSVDYSNLYLLISKTHHSNDVKKQFVSSILPKFILKLETVPASPNVCCEKLKCLEKVLKYYNGPCFSHYKSIERFLLQCIETWHSQDTILVHTGLCHALLAQLGGGGHQTSLYRDNWQTALCKLIKYGHEVLDSVFEDVPEIQTVPIPASIRALEVTIPFPSYYSNTRDTSKLHASEHLLRAFKVLSTLIRTHLAAPFPAPKTVNIEAVLSVVARTLSVTPPVLSNLDVTSGHAILLSMLPELHAQAHAMLGMLITVAGRNLIPHSLYICKLTLHSLKWTNTEEGARYSLDRPFRVLRCAVYRTLHSWLTLAGYSSNIELMAEELVGYILADITYEKPPVILTAVTKKTRKKHKTKVGLEAEKRPLAAGSGNRAELRETGDSLCALAHLVLGDLLKSAGLLLKPDLIKNIQTQICGLLLPLTTGAPVPPYSTCVASRLALYSSLASLILYSAPLVPDLSHYASVFYHAGLNDSHCEIRELCQRGIEVLEKVHHPKADSLNFVLENLEEEKLKLIGTLISKEGKQSILTNGINGNESHSEEESEEESQVDKKANKNKGRQGKDNVKGREKPTEMSKETNKRKRNEKRDEMIDEEDGRKSKKLKEISSKNEDGKKRKKQNKNKDNGDRQLALIDSKKSKKKKRSILDLEDSDDIVSVDTDEDLKDSDDSDMSDDSDDFGDESVAMMLVNALGNNSDYDFEDDDSDEDEGESDSEDSDESDVDSDEDVGDLILDGFRVNSSMVGGDSDDSLVQWESQDEESSESDDSREGVVITEIVEEETTATVETNEIQGDEENSKAVKNKAEKSSESEKDNKKLDKNSPKKDKKGVKDNSKNKKGKKEIKNDGNKGESEKMEIDVIDLGNDESSQDVGEQNAKKDGKVVSTQEEITLSSDSQDEDVIACDDKVKDKGELGKKNDDSKEEAKKVDEEEADDDVAEEIDDCLKLFSAE